MTLATSWKFCLSNLVVPEAGGSPAKMWSGLPSRGEHFYSKTWTLGSGVSIADSFECCVESWGVVSCFLSRRTDRSEGVAVKSHVYDSIVLGGVTP